VASRCECAKQTVAFISRPLLDIANPVAAPSYLARAGDLSPTDLSTRSRFSKWFRGNVSWETGSTGANTERVC